MFHYGLNNILITQELGKLERSWSHFLLSGVFKASFKYAKKIKRKKVVETSDSTETKPSSENKSGDCYEQVGPEEITSAQLPEEEPRWEKNDSPVLGSVDEMQTVKEGLIHTKNISE